MTRHNSLLECERCHENTLEVIGSDITEKNVGIRRYRCTECRHTYTTLEAFYLDDEGDPDCFNQIALNTRLREREAHARRTGRKPRRQLKATDVIWLIRGNGSLTLRYIRRKKQPAIFYECKYGHSLMDAANVYVIPKTGMRVCKTCRRAYQRDWIRQEHVKARRREAWRANAASLNERRRARKVA